MMSNHTPILRTLLLGATIIAGTAGVSALAQVPPPTSRRAMATPPYPPARPRRRRMHFRLRRPTRRRRPA
ncbi:hypothetical protein [Komagataeibacter oboediens]|uniref:hypothetical protein n=1 Tax=Komagataeibacter oboediens TaxID=65958 RepID=UPI0002F18314